MAKKIREDVPMIILSPSLLAADCANMERDIKKIEKHVEWLHVDVMDGHFVPNISYGVPVVKAVRKITDLFLDVHLMITNPLRYVDPFALAGADMITFHIEAEDNPAEVIEKIISRGVKCGIALKPKTPVSEVINYIKSVDMILQMTVEPGFGGQSMVEGALQNVSEFRKMFPNLDIQVDGGVNADNAERLAAVGANVLVAGTAVFGASDPGAAADLIRNNANFFQTDFVPWGK